MEDQKKAISCRCDKVSQVGTWEGKSPKGDELSGPKVRCNDCDVTFKLTWKKWRELPEENKTSQEQQENEGV